MQPTVVVHSAKPASRLFPLIERVFSQSVRDVDVLVVAPALPPDWDRIQAAYPVEGLEVPGDSSVAGMLNAAFSRLDSDVVISLEAGWMPRSPHWLMSLTRHFVDDRLQAVCGADFDPARLSLRQPAYRQDLLDLLSAPQYGLSFANAAFRRDAWRARPFDTRNHTCADKQWAYGLLRDGGAVLFDYDARCHQGDPLSPEALFRRYWELNLAFSEFIEAQADVRRLFQHALGESWRLRTLGPVIRVWRQWGTIKRQRFWQPDPTQAMLARAQFTRAGTKWAH